MALLIFLTLLHAIYTNLSKKCNIVAGCLVDLFVLNKCFVRRCAALSSNQSICDRHVALFIICRWTADLDGGRAADGRDGGSGQAIGLELLAAAMAESCRFRAHSFTCKVISAVIHTGAWARGGRQGCRGVGAAAAERAEDEGCSFGAARREKRTFGFRVLICAVHVAVTKLPSRTF